MKDLLRKFMPRNIIIVILFVIISLAETATSVTLSKTVNAMTLNNSHSFSQSLMLTFIIYLVFLVFTYLKSLYQSTTQEKMKEYLRHRLSNQLIQTDYQSFNEHKPSTYASWFMNDIQQIANQSLTPFYDLLASIITLIISFMTLLSVHWFIMLYIVFALFLMLCIPKIFHQMITKHSLKLTMQNEIYLNKISDYLHGYDTLFSYQQLPYMHQKMSEESKNLSRVALSFNKAMTIVAIAGGLGNILAQMGIFWITGYLVLQNKLPIGAIIITTTLSGNIFNTAGNLSQYLSMIQSSQPIFAKFNQITMSPKTQIELTHPHYQANCHYEIKQLNFAYGDQPIIKNGHFIFDSQHNYAITGKSGSGKSTLLNLLSGKETHYSGSLKFNGQEVKELNYQTLYEHILYIDQNPHIFDGSIRENLELGDSYPDEALWDALDKVNLKTFITDQEGGLDYYVAESGKRLSGGQKQRLSIARALLRDKKILLLDEVTSHLDHDTAQAIENVLLDAPSGIIMITHHLKEALLPKIKKIYQL